MIDKNLNHLNQGLAISRSFKKYRLITVHINCTTTVNRVCNHIFITNCCCLKISLLSPKF